MNFQTAQLNVAQKESLIGVSADTALKSAFKENPLINVWLVLKNEYEQLSDLAMGFLMHFPTTVIV